MPRRSPATCMAEKAPFSRSEPAAAARSGAEPLPPAGDELLGAASPAIREDEELVTFEDLADLGEAPGLGKLLDRWREEGLLPADGDDDPAIACLRRFGAVPRAQRGAEVVAVPPHARPGAEPELDFD